MIKNVEHTVYFYIYIYVLVIEFVHNLINRLLECEKITLKPMPLKSPITVIGKCVNWKATE